MKGLQLNSFEAFDFLKSLIRFPFLLHKITYYERHIEHSKKSKLGDVSEFCPVPNHIFVFIDRVILIKVFKAKLREAIS